MKAILACCIVMQGCGGAANAPYVSFVDQESVREAKDPLDLVISIDAEGRLTLNQIETGTIGDPGELTEKLRTIFEDRRRSSINEAEVLIEMAGTVAFDDIDALITSLRPLGPSRITVVNR